VLKRSAVPPLDSLPSLFFWSGETLGDKLNIEIAVSIVEDLGNNAFSNKRAPSI